MTDTLAHRHLRVLDGLRFFAAFFVICAHYSSWVILDQHLTLSSGTQLFIGYIESFSAMGMSIFFVLSGFVIHYNYRDTCRQPGGQKRFFIARFTRLYPLFIVLFLGEFATSFRMHRGSCGHTDILPWGYVFALPYYLTFTESWFYSVICKDSLIEQYHMVSDVAWSLSVEAFFYLSYVFLVGWISRPRSIGWQIRAILLVEALVVAYLFTCHHYEAQINYVAKVAFGPVGSAVESNYQNSFLRWLYYFNPVMNMGAFLTGNLVANLYLIQKDKPLSPTELRYGGLFTLLSLLLLLAVHLYLFTLGLKIPFYGCTASSLYVPLVGLPLYCLVRYHHTGFVRFIGSTLPVKLGQASYSIYLLHALFAWNARDYYYLHLNPWVLYAISITCVLIISRYCYLYFERPVQRWLRVKMGDTVMKAQTIAEAQGAL
jgi:peptidoglycan/LPS O-acetylase OafA/YrhL